MQEATAPQFAQPYPRFTEAQMRELGVTNPPTHDELPYSDGMPMESNYHVLQMYLLIETLKLHWQERDDVFIGGNMFVYFSAHQSRTSDYRGPDFFVVQGVAHRPRNSWVVWEEGKGPDLVIELLSPTTAHLDRTDKKLVYQDNLRVPEYFLFDPNNGDFEGFGLRDGIYEPLVPDAQGRLISEQCQLALVRWDGVYSREHSRWLRWETLDGKLLPTAEEQAAELAAQLGQYRERFGSLPE